VEWKERREEIMKIKKIKEEVTFQEKNTEHVFEVNGKEIKVGSWFKDSNYGDYDNEVTINEDDKKLLTDEELEEFEEYMSENLDLKVDEEWSTDEICEKCGKPHDITDCDKKDELNPCATHHKTTDKAGLCLNCGYNTLHLTNKELKEKVK
jgi:hypothetical protein